MSKTVRVRPRFAPFESTPVPRYGKGAEVLEDCRLIRADRVVGNEAWFERVAEICNEPRVYDLLFGKKLEGQPYRPERARGFLAWGKQGWKYGTHFLFFVNDSNGRLLAALDMKSPDWEDAEIGYWATENSPGVMTAAVERMMSAGREAGYRSLHAYVVPGNQRSIGVLERAGFDSEGLKESRGKPMLRFSKRLTEPRLSRTDGWLGPSRTQPAFLEGFRIGGRFGGRITPIASRWASIDSRLSRSWAMSRSA